jgi:dolichol-phosphate mannosyltransferase
MERMQFDEEIKPLISVVISFYNEEEVLPELIRRLQSVLKSLPVDYELIFVNDASSDRSLELLMEERKKDKNIKIINMSRRFGVSQCFLAGLRYSKGDAVIYMEADLQDPPELIPILLQKWKEGADIVHTIRTKRKGENFFRIFIFKLAYKLINLVSDIKIPQDAGNFKLLSRRAVDKLLQLNEYDPFLRGLVCWIGFKQVRVFYEREPRFAGKTHFPLWKSAEPMKEFIRGITSFSVLPLYFSLFAGFLISFGALVYLTYILIAKIIGMHLSEWSVISGVMLLLGGIILISIGILGIYIGRIHFAVQNRPNYIIESMIGFDGEEKKEIKI